MRLLEGEDRGDGLGLVADDVGERGNRRINQGSVTIRTDVQAAINFGELNGEAVAPPDRGGTTGATDYPILCFRRVAGASRTLRLPQIRT